MQSFTVTSTGRYDLLKQRNERESPCYALRPPELFLLITSYCQEPTVHKRFASFTKPGPRCTPLSLTQVSQKWKDAAHAELTLWSSISATQHNPCSPNPALVEAWIARCGTEKLLDFHLSPSGFPEEKDVFTLAILRIFLRHKDRWNNVCFTLNSALGRTFIAALNDLGTGQPTRATSVELDVRGCSVDDAGEILASLPRFLAIEKLSWHGSPQINETLSACGATVNLATLETLVIEASSFRDAALSLKPFGAPALQALTLVLGHSSPSSTWDSETGGLKDNLERLKPEVLTIEDHRIGPREAKLLLCLVHDVKDVSKLVIESNSIMDFDNGFFNSPFAWLLHSKDIWEGLTIEAGHGLKYLRPEYDI